MKMFYIAIDDEERFKEISEYLINLKINVFSKDLIYEDAIIDLLKDEKEDSVLLIDGKIIENIKRYKKFLDSNVEIYIFDDDELKRDLFRRNSFKNVFENNDLNIYFIKSKILNIKDNNVIKNIELLKSEIIKFNNNTGIINKDKKSKTEIIVFTGESKAGKTSLALNAINNIKNNKKILYIDLSYKSRDLLYKFDLLNKDVKMYEKDINGNKVSFLFNTYFFIKQKIYNGKEDSFTKMKKLLNNYKKIYDVIIIDLDKNIDYKIIKCIFLFANKVFFVIEPISLEICNSINLIEQFLKMKIIDEYKIFIVFNKYDYNSISQEILKEVFKKYTIECIVKRKMKYRKILNKEVKYGYKFRE